MSKQRQLFENLYESYADSDRWSFHDTPDPLIRYLRDRRLNIALNTLAHFVRISPHEMSALAVCGGVGGESTYLANIGIRQSLVSDFSLSALRTARKRDDRLQCVACDVERLALASNSVDLLLVQDGLHHLRRPPLGVVEMLRVARRAVIVIEPHLGLVGKLCGTEWERHDGSINYVFRWNRALVDQVVRSYLLDPSVKTKVLRLWDHNEMTGRLVKHIPGGGRTKLLAAKLIYGILNTFFRRAGNMMIALIIKPEDEVQR